MPNDLARYVLVDDETDEDIESFGSAGAAWDFALSHGYAREWGDGCMNEKMGTYEGCHLEERSADEH